MQQEFEKRNNADNPLTISNRLARRVIIISYLFLFLISGLGAILRIAPFFSLNISYSNITHAHSHGAFLGWLFLANYAITVYYCNYKIGKREVIWLIADVVLMFLSIPLFSYYGYNLATIIVSTIHVLISSFLALKIIKSIGFGNLYSYNGFKSYFVLAWLCLIISGIFPLILGIIVKLFGSGSPAYYNTIYSYLHFQYNGFFIGIILAIAHIYISKEGERELKGAYYCFAISVILTLFNSYLWCEPGYIFNFISAMACLLQIYGCYLFLNKGGISTWFSIKAPINMGWIIYGLVLKSLMQLTASIPSIAEVISVNRYLVLFYLHLVFIGIISIPVVKTTALLINISHKSIFKTIVYSLTFIFAITEILLIYKAAELENITPDSIVAYPLLAVTSCVFPLILVTLLWYAVWSKPKAS